MKRKYKHTIGDYLKAGHIITEIIDNRDVVIWDITNGKIPNHLKKRFLEDVAGETVYV